MSKSDYNKVAVTLRHGCSNVNVLHIFRTPFPKNIFGGTASDKKIPFSLTAQ